VFSAGVIGAPLNRNVRALQTREDMSPSKAQKRTRTPRTFVVDMTHWLTKDGAIAAMPTAARRLAEYMGMIVADATACPTEQNSEQRVECRCRPGRKPCPGKIESDFEPETDRIIWWCPECGENGFISNWKGTLWDRTTDQTAH